MKTLAHSFYLTIFIMFSALAAFGNQQLYVFAQTEPAQTIHAAILLFTVIWWLSLSGLFLLDGLPAAVGDALGYLKYRRKKMQATRTEGGRQ